MDRVPFLDLAAATAELRQRVAATLSRVLDRGWFILGEECASFETEWARRTASDHCVGVGNGLDALQLALRALGVGPGAEVIVPSNTYIATWLAVTQTGAVPVPVEPDPATYNLDPNRVEGAITVKTRAVLPVHLYGQPADMDAINEIASRHGLDVLDDAAQAHGALYKGRPVGSLADATAWSFYPSKNLGAIGDAGAVTTNRPEVCDHVRMLCNYGSNVKNVNEVVGYNSRLDEIQAAVLRVKVQVLDEWNERRRLVAARYLSALSAAGVRLPTVPEWATPAWHLFVIRSPRRDELRAHLAERGVEAAIHYPQPPHLQQAYRHLGLARGSLAVSEAIHREVLSLPIGPHLSSDQTEQVIDAVLSFPGAVVA